MADGGRYGSADSLRRVESRDWRYGWAADDPRWTEDATRDAAWNSSASGTADGSATGGVPAIGAGPITGGLPAVPDLWGEPSWPPQPPQPRPPISGPPGPTPASYGAPGPSTTSTGGIPAVRGPGVTSTGGLPALRGPSGLSPVRPGYGLVTPPAGPGPVPRGLSRQRTRPASRRRPEDSLPDEPGYGSVLVLTAGWYLLPVLLYLVWLVTVGNDRPGSAGSDVVGSVPWLVAAVLLSLAVAGLLRWSIVGWRALTLSFAAAVIGSGVATIAHSLSQ